MTKMFTDLCFPNNNEKEFLGIANKLKIKSLCFIYYSRDKVKTIKDNNIKTHTALLTNNPIWRKDNGVDYLLCNINTKIIVPDKRVLYFFDNDENNRSFHAPLDILNQVIIKEMVNEDKKLCIPFSYIIKCKESPRIVEKVAFVIRLCKKYKVKVYIASFANNPYGLRSKNELQSVGRISILDVTGFLNNII
jgi:hypothetical protein